MMPLSLLLIKEPGNDLARSAFHASALDWRTLLRERQAWGLNLMIVRTCRVMSLHCSGLGGHYPSALAYRSRKNPEVDG